MTNSKKLIAFMGGMIDEEKNCYFIRSMEEECKKHGYLMIVFGFSETTFSDQDRNNCEMKLTQMAGFLDLKAIIVQLEFIKNEYLIAAFIPLPPAILPDMPRATIHCYRSAIRRFYR